jgi:HSF-type DNA-binding
MNKTDTAASAPGPSPSPNPQGSGGEQKEMDPPKQPTPSQFPDKLMSLLENKTVPDALWWLPDLGAMKGVFAINKKVFTKKVLDLAFNGNKWPSITRNFNRWCVLVCISLLRCKHIETVVKMRSIDVLTNFFHYLFLMCCVVVVVGPCMHHDPPTIVSTYHHTHRQGIS